MRTRPLQILTLLAVLHPFSMFAADAKLEYPFSGLLPLEERALLIEESIEKNNISHGIPMPRVLLPPEGNADNSSAHQEDGTNRIGPLMAAYCYRYKVTGDPAALERAVRTAHTMEKLERVTGVDGAIARSFNLTDKIQRHETWFFFPAEWHWSSRFENTRWLGDPSSDSLTRFLYGNAVYYDLVADEAEKERVRALVDRVLTRFVDHNFKIVDVDGKTTLWGNYSPDLPHQPLNSILALAAIKIGIHIVGSEKYESAYRRLIDDYGYHEDTLAGDLPMNLEEGVHWDHDLGMLGIHHLLEYETDPNLRTYYLNSLERFHNYDRSRKTKAPFYEFLYKIGKRDFTPVGPDVVEALVGWNGAWKQHRSEMLTEVGGAKLVEGVWQECGEKFPRTYWLGRHYGFIDENSGAPDAVPPKPVRPKPSSIPEGMVLVPAGEFLMGAKHGDIDESPEHRVDLPAFYIDRYEVTNAEFKRFQPGHGFPEGAENHAAKNISWEEADAYAASVGKRLPTEAEWEKAARGTEARLFPWGNKWFPGLVPKVDGGPVDARPNGASPYGCEMMAGNVWEWTADWYAPYPGNDVASEAYGRRFKVMRGGADFNGVIDYRTTTRFYLDPKTKIGGYAVGFRCAKDVE